MSAFSDGERRQLQTLLRRQAFNDLIAFRGAVQSLVALAHRDIDYVASSKHLLEADLRFEVESALARLGRLLDGVDRAIALAGGHATDEEVSVG